MLQFLCAGAKPAPLKLSALLEPKLIDHLHRKIITQCDKVRKVLGALQVAKEQSVLYGAWDDNRTNVCFDDVVTVTLNHDANILQSCLSALHFKDFFDLGGNLVDIVLQRFVSNVVDLV